MSDSVLTRSYPAYNGISPVGGPKFTYPACFTVTAAVGKHGLPSGRWYERCSSASAYHGTGRSRLAHTCSIGPMEIRSTGTLCRFVGGMRCFRSGKMNTVARPATTAVRRFGFRYVGRVRGVVLQRTVDRRSGTFFLRGTRRFTYFLYVAALRARCRWVRALPRGSMPKAMAIRELNRDFCQLLCGRVWVDCAVAVNVNLFRQ